MNEDSIDGPAEASVNPLDPPEKSTQPTEPEKPTEPEHPEQPEQPVKPEQPAEPDQKAEPEQSANPEQLVEPAQLAEPTQPTEPDSSRPSTPAPLASPANPGPVRQVARRRVALRRLTRRWRRLLNTPSIRLFVNKANRLKESLKIVTVERDFRRILLGEEHWLVVMLENIITYIKKVLLITRILVPPNLTARELFQIDEDVNARLHAHFGLEYRRREFGQC